MSLRVAAIALVCAGLVAATCRDGSEGTVLDPQPPLPRVQTPGDLGARAYQHVAVLVGYGPRHPGSRGWERSVDYIAQTLTNRTSRLPVRDRWTDPDNGITFENVHITFPGESPHRIIIACHHDTKKCADHDDPSHNFTFVGANDSGSGVGLLLALAEELDKRKNRATFQLVFFDGEESLPFDWDINQALFGSRRFVAAEREREITPGVAKSKIEAMVLLDMVGARDLQIDWEENSDAELRSIFRRAARACGHDDYFFKRRMPITDDHIPFIDEGIPAIDLIDLVDNPQWHTPEDTLEHISADSMQLVGEVVLTALPAIEARYFPEPSQLDLPEGR